MRTEYRATDDPDRFIKEETQETTVLLSEVEKQIVVLSTELQNVPQMKIRPDQETLQFWNDLNIDDAGKAELVERRDGMIALAQKLRELKVQSVNNILFCSQ